MIYYFSGTGNSLHVARHLSSLLGENIQEITLTTEAEASSTCTGLVFPVYAWGLPNIVLHFIKKNASHISNSQYVYSVMTCGDDIGYADRILRKHLNGHLNAAFSVPMPNTYVCLPGFDTDTDEVANAKLTKTKNMMPHIIDRITKKEHATEVTRGNCPWIKSYVLRPLFNRFLVNDKHFHTTNACILCKRCVNTCPTHNIEIYDNHIQWQHFYCTGCLRCYHTCPQKAIEYGSFTKNKRQKNIIK